MAWTTGIALVALGLSIYNLVEVRLKARRASLSARYEFYRPPPTSGGLDEQRKVSFLLHEFERVVVTNHGPAVARDLRCEIADADGSLEWGPSDGPHELAMLHPGHEHHIDVIKYDEFNGPASILMHWRDGRRREQQVRIFLSRQRLVR